MNARKRTITGMGITAMLVVGLLSYGMLPAYASASSSASVDVRDILAGTPSRDFTVTVNNTGAAGSGGIGGIGGTPADPTINFVSIVAPAGGFEALTGAAQGSGWTPIPLDNREIVFTGGEITPGNNAKFTITTKTPVPASEITKAWRVAVSSNNGQTMSISGEASSNSLKTTVRVLTTTLNGLTSPAGTVDLGVTEGQTATGQCTVTNHGSGSLTVTPSITGARISGGDNLGTSSVPAGGSAAFSKDLTFGTPGATTATCNATATEGASTPSGFNSSKQITIEQKVGFNLSGLNPTVVVPGSSIPFKVNATKTGVPAITLDPATTKFSFPGFGPVDLSAPVTFPRGSSSAVLEFAPGLIPSGRDKRSASVTITGEEDDNNASVDLGTLPVGQITLDPDVPLVEPGLPGNGTPAGWPGSVPDYDKVPEAVKNGDTNPFNGTIKDTSSTPPHNLENCGTCTITTSFLRQYDADGNAISGADIPVNATNGGGNIGGSYGGGYDAAARSVELHVTAEDAAGHSATGISGRVEIDNIRPTITLAETRRDAASAAREDQMAQNKLFIQLSECVAGATSRFDWTVDGNNTVTEVTQVGCTKAADGSLRSSLTLTMLNDFPDDGPLGTVTYQPVTTGGISGRFFDRVNLTVADAVVNITDGIRPIDLVIDTVNGLSRYDDVYWTNTTGPQVKLLGDRALSPGYSVELYQETNGTEGLQRSSDRKIGSADVLQEGQVTLTANQNGGLTAGDGAKTVYALAIDASGNLSPVLQDTFTLDTAVPAISSAVAQDGKIVVTFTEPLRFGRDFAADWRIFDADSERIFVNAVSGTGATRELSITDPLYDKSNLASLLYQYIGPSGQRYQDRATNELGNFTTTTFGS